MVVTLCLVLRVVSAGVYLATSVCKTILNIQQKIYETTMIFWCRNCLLYRQPI